MAEEASLEHTPTWVVATVCLVIVSVSLAAERFLHYLGKVRPPSVDAALMFGLLMTGSEVGANQCGIQPNQCGCFTSDAPLFL